MPHNWKPETLRTADEVLAVLPELSAKKWVCRGQPSRYNTLEPTIDRDPRKTLPRDAKLALERVSIDTLRENTQHLNEGEVGVRWSVLVALMVLRHHGVPTRLLDWSISPHVAAYFACEEIDTKPGEIWSFDEPLYEQEGAKQWRRWPETTYTGSGEGKHFDAVLTAFTAAEPPDWIVCHFYPPGFPRQNAQSGFYTMTARFGRDHADKIEELLANPRAHHLYVIPPEVKAPERKRLREEHDIWRGSLYPDTAGAAETAKQAFNEAQARYTGPAPTTAPLTRRHRAQTPACRVWPPRAGPASVPPLKTPETRQAPRKRTQIRPSK